MRECYYDAKTNSIADVNECQPFGVWIITRINVPIKERGHGHGTSLLKQILMDADIDGTALCLCVSPSDGLSGPELIKWYKRHGFYRDRNPEWTGIKDVSGPEFEGLMRREPLGIEVILREDETAYIRRNAVRCNSCQHLAILHRPASPSFVYCQIGGCKCTVKFNSFAVPAL